MSPFFIPPFLLHRTSEIRNNMGGLGFIETLTHLSTLLVGKSLPHPRRNLGRRISEPLSRTVVKVKVDRTTKVALSVHVAGTPFCPFLNSPVDE
jgi:hypothetical protein